MRLLMLTTVKIFMQHIDIHSLNKVIRRYICNPYSRHGLFIHEIWWWYQWLLSSKYMSMWFWQATWRMESSLKIKIYYFCYCKLLHVSRYFMAVWRDHAYVVVNLFQAKQINKSPIAFLIKYINECPETWFD